MSKKSRSYLSTEIVKKIKELIFSGELTPGEQIRQDEFAERLGVSRTPLLHALQILKSEMLLESFPNRGMFVRKVSLQELKDIFEYREAIETMACRLASQRITRDEIQQLRDLFKPFENTTGMTHIQEYQKADQLFHSMVIQFSGNSVFPRMVSLGNVYVTAYQKGLLRYPAETLPEHLAIIDALDAGDGQKAEHLMRQHLSVSIKGMNQLLEAE